MAHRRRMTIVQLASAALELFLPTESPASALKNLSEIGRCQVPIYTV